jgi:glutamate-1-semialdehyde 2,1-aminomutase
LAELVQRLVPSAELVRFTSSGSEAVQLSFRVARAYTGRRTIIRLEGQFHGWHGEALAHFVDFDHNGIHPLATECIVVADPSSFDAIELLLEDDDIAAIVLEPGGGGSGCLPYDPSFLMRFREATARSNTALIFDEIVSGFRYSPGGVQASCGITPDLTLLGKILFGGLPGGAVAGGAGIMSVFGRGTVVGTRAVRVPHTGTFNANPLSAAAGIAMLEQFGDGEPQRVAENAARQCANGH